MGLFEKIKGGWSLAGYKTDLQSLGMNSAEADFVVEFPLITKRLRSVEKEYGFKGKDALTLILVSHLMACMERPTEIPEGSLDERFQIAAGLLMKYYSVYGQLDPVHRLISNFQELAEASSL